jgi:ABC-2 type transport system ATP-binding protein
MEVIKTDSLSKQFQQILAVNNFSINVQRGDVYGFVGLNGAGKTTFIRMILGMIKANTGIIHLFGTRLTANFKLWNNIGYMVETPGAYPNLSVQENLEVYFKLRRLENKKLIGEIIERLKLEPYRDIQARNLSLGNLQRLSLAKALFHKPKLLILDEPINSLDPAGIVEVRNLLKELVAEGATVFLSSHILGEVAKICNRIGIIHEGRLITELYSTELECQLRKKLLVNTLNNDGAIELLTNKGFHVEQTNNQTLEISTENAISAPESISKLLTDAGYPPNHVSVHKEDLEQYFLRIVTTTN